MPQHHGPDIKHAAHFKQVGGSRIIGLGSDFDGIGGKLERATLVAQNAPAGRCPGKRASPRMRVEAIFFRNAQRFFENNL